MQDLDDAIDALETAEAKERGGLPGANATKGKMLVGTVEQFYDRLNVAAVKLNGKLSVGDIIEIGDEEEAIRQKVLSMQINREDVIEAYEGDDIGIKVRCAVPVGSQVFLVR